MFAKCDFSLFNSCVSLNGLSFLGVQTSRSFGVQLSFSQMISTCFKRKTCVSLFSILDAVCDAMPAFTRKVWGLCIPRALKIELSWNRNILLCFVDILDKYKACFSNSFNCIGVFLLFPLFFVFRSLAY